MRENAATRLLLPGRLEGRPSWLDRCPACPPPKLIIEHTCGSKGKDRLPGLAEWADWRERAAAAELGTILLGPGGGVDRWTGEPLGELWDLRDEDPHFGLSAGTRRGKTTLFLIIAMQILAQGGTVIGIDPKLVSLEALEGLPGCLIYCDPWNVPAMWQAIATFRKEVEHRAKARKMDRSATFPRMLLLIDEINLFSELSQMEWEAQAGKKKPPMWNDLAMGLWTGAQFGAHVGVAGQRLDQRSTGNRGLRDSFGLRLTAGVPPNQVDMLYGPGEGRKITYPNIRGRFHAKQGETQRWIQVPRVTDPYREVRDYVLSHRPPDPNVGGAMVPGNQLCYGASYLRQAIGCTPIVGGWQPGADYLGIKLETFKSARKRHPIEGEFRLGRSPAWTQATLTTWRNEYGG